MNASKYIKSQKGKIVEKMKTAYLSGKHIIIIEKLEDYLLKEIILDSSIIKYCGSSSIQAGCSEVNSQTSTTLITNTDDFISERIENISDKTKLYIYKCKDSVKSNSPQVSNASTLPELSLKNYLEHLSGLSSLRVQADYKEQYKALRDSIILILSNTSVEVPERYAPYIEYIKVPLLELGEFTEVVSKVISSKDKILLTTTADDYSLIDSPNADKYINELYNCMKGLGTSHIKAILSKTKVEKGCIYTENHDIKKTIMSYIREEANRIISLSNSLSIIDASESSEPAGLGNMSAWIKNHKDIIRDSSQYEFMEMSAPKGILVSGIPGTGKSMMAKFIAKELELPLVRFDLGDLLGGFVGDSERNMRESLATIDALAPCVVWVDEMEKAFSASSNAHETTKRLIGKFLTWMQEKKSASFVFATANDISSMPPEMFRSGRFDEKFYTFLPSAEDCGKIFESIIFHQNQTHKRKTANNLEAKPLFPAEINAQLFVKLLNQEYLCIKDKQDFKDEFVTRRNKFFIGSDIAKLVEDAKSLYIRAEGFTHSFESAKFIQHLCNAIERFKSYGETNLDDVAKCFSKLARINFTSACDSSTVIVPFEGYDELECSKGNKLYNIEFNPRHRNVYDQQMFVSVRNTLNSFGRQLIQNR